MLRPITTRTRSVLDLSGLWDSAFDPPGGVVTFPSTTSPVAEGVHLLQAG